jgi:hypothetical protein
MIILWNFKCKTLILRIRIKIENMIIVRQMTHFPSTVKLSFFCCKLMVFFYDFANFPCYCLECCIWRHIISFSPVSVNRIMFLIFWFAFHIFLFLDLKFRFFLTSIFEVDFQCRRLISKENFYQTTIILNIKYLLLIKFFFYLFWEAI